MRCQKGNLRYFTPHRSSGSQVIDGVTADPDAKEQPPRQGTMRLTKAAAPSHGVNHLCDSFAENKEDQSPTEQPQFSPDFPNPNRAHQVNEKSKHDTKEDEIDLFHTRRASTLEPLPFQESV